MWKLTFYLAIIILTSSTLVDTNGTDVGELNDNVITAFYSDSVLNDKNEDICLGLSEEKDESATTNTNKSKKISSIKRYRKSISRDTSLTPLITKDDCFDLRNECESWSTNGECDINQQFMHQHCKKSCRACDCEDVDQSCSGWATMGECENNPSFMLQKCRKSCNLCGAKADDTMKEDDMECKDTNPKCNEWALTGQCDMNPNYMSYYCKASCNKCIEENNEHRKEPECNNSNDKCPMWANTGECEKNAKFMMQECKKSCRVCLDFGVKQTGPIGQQELLSKVVKNSTEYYRNEIMKKEEYIGVRDLCKNKHEHCAYWASFGECESNVKYMNSDCALACRTCDQLDMKVRCPVELKSEDAIRPGDLEKMFLKITNTSDFTQYQPKTLSKPSSDSPEKPWIIMLDSFLTPEECDAIIEQGEQIGFTRSKVDANARSDGFFDSAITLDRTSTNTWCTDTCNSHPVVKDITQRIVNMTSIPEQNMENFQLLKYTKGQYYLEHHDFNVHHIEGPRMLTFFIYLNDVTSGGETNFTQLGIAVKPKKGRVVLWPSVLLNNHTVAEKMTYHESVSVNDGVKYAANVWIHLNDFKTPMALGCTG